MIYKFKQLNKIFFKLILFIGLFERVKPSVARRWTWEGSTVQSVLSLKSKVKGDIPNTNLKKVP